MKFPSHRQTDISTCGPACLQNILEYYGHKTNISEIIRRAKTDHRGNSFYSLIQAAASYGLETEPYENAQISDVQPNMFPFIAHVIVDQQLEHYIVLFGMDSYSFWVSDPSKGCVKILKSTFASIWTGHLLLLRKGSNFQTKSRSRNPLLYFLYPIKKQKKLIILLITMSAIITGIGTVTSFFYKKLTNDLLPLNSAPMLLEFAGLTCFLIIMRFFLSYLRDKSLNMFHIIIENEITFATIEHILHLPIEYIRSKNIGDWQSRISEISKVSGVLCSAILSLFIDVAMFFFGLILLMNINFALCCITALAGLLFFIITVIYNRILYSQTETLMQQYAKRNGYTTEMLYGLSSVKANAEENKCKDKVKNLQQQLADNQLECSKSESRRSNWISGIYSVLQIVLLAVGGLQIIAGLLDLGTLLAFVSLTVYFLDPVQQLSSLDTQLRTASISAGRILDIWHEEHESKGGDLQLTDAPQIEVTGLAYAYGFREPIFTDGTFRLEKGCVTAIIGKNGCGKSTLGQLLVGLCKKTKGEILLDGMPIEEFDTYKYREDAVYIPQDTFLFQESIRQNLVGNQKEISQIEVEEILQKLGIWEKIIELPLGLDSVLSENGFNLSGGERQCLALSRAFLHKPKILILDETTDAMDLGTRQRVKNLLCDLRGLTTILIITHQIDMLDWCDSFIWIRGGTLTTVSSGVMLQNDLIKEII